MCSGSQLKNYNYIHDRFPSTGISFDPNIKDTSNHLLYSIDNENWCGLGCNQMALLLSELVLGTKVNISSKYVQTEHLHLMINTLLQMAILINTIYAIIKEKPFDLVLLRSLLIIKWQMDILVEILT